MFKILYPTGYQDLDSMVNLEVTLYQNDVDTWVEVSNNDYSEICISLEQLDLFIEHLQVVRRIVKEISHGD